MLASICAHRSSRAGGLRLSRLIHRVGMALCASWCAGPRGATRVIVITGPSARATRLLAALYSGLGVATTPPDETAELNSTIARDLGMTTAVELLDWGLLDEAVGKHGPALRDFAARSVVAADPRFASTLPVWFKAAADISAVVLATTSLRALRAGGSEAGSRQAPESSQGSNRLAYGVGVTLSACWDAGIEPVVIAYPELGRDLVVLHSKLPLLSDRPLEDFLDAAASVVEPGMAHR